MSWDNPRMPHTGQLLPLPDDGIAVSNHPPGWLGKRWRALLDDASSECGDRVRRGKNYARRGRLRGLHVAPGCAAAEVMCEEVFHPTVRVRSFSRQEWSTIGRELTADLNLIASLLEGELPSDLVARLDARDIHLLPTYDELGFDCDCGDYVMPCTHAATIFQVLTDALDGDPFLLMTMRGRDRDALLAQLRSDWGDDAPLAQGTTYTEEPVPEADWFDTGVPLPDFGCHWGASPTPGAGLRALGPPPGEDDLLGTLLPLYEAGHGQLRAMIEAIPDRPEPRRRPRVEPVVIEPELLDEDDEDEAFVSVDLTERLVDALATADGSSSAELAEMLSLSVSEVRGELVDLLALGLVYRQQDTGEVRWFLG